MCGQSLKTVFWIFEKSPWEHYRSKKIILEINFYTFKVTTTKFSWQFTMFQELFYMFKTLKKSMWIGGFFVSKVIFSYQNVHQIISIF
jgi:hypothetical protein